MNEMTMQLVTFFEKYGWQLTVIACSGIFLLGVLKFFKVFEEIEKSKRKYVYTGISGFFSILTSAIYLAIEHTFQWESFGITAAAILSLNQCVYSLYESLGIRAAFRWVGNGVLQFLANKAKERIENDKQPTEQAVEELK